MRRWIIPDAGLRGVGPGWSVVGSRRREVDVAAFVKQMLRLRRFMSHFVRLAADLLSAGAFFCALGPLHSLIPLLNKLSVEAK
jgi:hypothetical protein